MWRKKGHFQGRNRARRGERMRIVILSFRPSFSLIFFEREREDNRKREKERVARIKEEGFVRSMKKRKKREDDDSWLMREKRMMMFSSFLFLFFLLFFLSFSLFQMESVSGSSHSPHFSSSFSSFSHSHYEEMKENEHAKRAWNEMRRRVNEKEGQRLHSSSKNEGKEEKK